MSRFYQPPVVWIAVLTVLLLPFIYRGGRERWMNLVLLIAVVGLAIPAGWTRGSREVVWSPYQKLSVFAGDGREPGVNYVVTVK